MTRPTCCRALLLAAAVALAGAGTALVVSRTRNGPEPPRPAAIAPITPITVVPASIAAVERSVPTQTTVFRLHEAPAVLVIAFGSMHEQAQALNRVAALVEKAGMPRDRVLPEADLAARLQAQSIDPDAFYDGHDYRAADLVRFFALAARDNQPLTPPERWVRALLVQEGWLRADGTPPAAFAGALISLPPPGPRIEATDRTTILRHELAHAVYFTDPAYHAGTVLFWTACLTEVERATFRTWLSAQGYDAGNEDLMRNEAQAYLLHTTNPRYFAPVMIGMDRPRYDALRSSLIAAMPDAWPIKASALSLPPPSRIEAFSVPTSAAPPLPPSPGHPAAHAHSSPFGARGDTPPPAPAARASPAAAAAPPR